MKVTLRQHGEIWDTRDAILEVANTSFDYYLVCLLSRDYFLVLASSLCASFYRRGSWAKRGIPATQSSRYSSFCLCGDVSIVPASHLCRDASIVPSSHRLMFASS